MAESEIGVMRRAVRERWLVVVAVVGVLAIAGAVVGRSGPTTYRAAATVRMQFPANLATVPNADDFSAWLRSSEIRAAAASATGLPAGAFSVSAAVPPANKRLVDLRVVGPGRQDARRFIQAMIDAGSAKAAKAVADQVSALRQAAKATEAALADSQEIRARMPELKARAKGDPSAEAAVLSLSIQSANSLSALLQDRAQVAATLSQLTKGVEIQNGPSVAADAAGGGTIGGAIRGTMVGLVVAALWLLWVTRAERAAVREAG